MSADTATILELVNTKTIQMIAFVRYKPSDKAMAAGSMLDKVSSTVKKGTDAVDGLLQHVPGVLQEQKNKDNPPEEAFTYHESYGKQWDKIIEETKNTLKEVNNKSELIIFDYDKEFDTASFVSQLEMQVKSTIQPWSNEQYALHFVGLAQGGNIAAEVALKIKDSLGQYGKIETILTVAAALHGDDNMKQFLSSIPTVVNYKNPFDLSSNAILYSKNPAKIIDTIKLANQTPIGYAYAMLVGKITKILAQLLNGLHVNSSQGIDPVKALIDTIKSDVESIVQDLFSFVKHIVQTCKDFIKLPDIDQKFDQVFGNVGGVASNSLDRLKSFGEEFKRMFDNKEGLSLDIDRLPIEKLFNFLVPPVLLINDALSALTIDLENNEPKNNLTEFTKKDAFHQPIYDFDTALATKDPYQQVVVDSAKAEDHDQATSMIATSKNSIEALSKASNDTEREQIGVTLSRTLMLPMMSSKTEVLGLVMKKLPSINNNPAISKIQTDTVTAPLKNLLTKVRKNFDFDDTDSDDNNKLGLKRALSRLDKRIAEIKSILEPSYFKIDKRHNSMHFIYNSHNISLVEMPAALRLQLDRATNIYPHMLAKGFEFDDVKGTYSPGKGGTKTENVMSVAEIETKK